MSYSFTVTADTKDEAGIKVEAELAKVVAAQPLHERDRQGAQNAAEAFINVLADPTQEQCIVVRVSGLLSSSFFDNRDTIAGASVSVSTNLQLKS